MSLSFKEFSTLTESHAAPHITMTLQQVIDAGKVTNTVQVVIMAQLIAALKDSPDNVAVVKNVSEYPISNIDSIKNLPAADQVELAKQLLLQISPGFHIGPCETDPTASSSAWINNVLRHQH